MSAGDHLNQQQFDPRQHFGLSDHEQFHATSPEHRASIAEQGLLVSKSNAFSGVQGVYMSHNVRPDVPGSQSDLWAVNTEGLPLRRDPIGYHDPSGRNSYVQQDVPPERLRIVQRATKAYRWNPETRKKDEIDVPPEGFR